MSIFSRMCKTMTCSFLLLCMASFPSTSFAQEQSGGDPYYFTIELSTKFLERNVTEDGFNFGGIQHPQMDASPTSARLLAKLAVDLTNNFQIYGLVGGSTLSVDEFNDYNSDMGFAYGGGFKISFSPETFSPETFPAPVKLFLDFNFFQFKTNDTIVFLPTCSPCESVNETIRWSEYVTKLGISARYDAFAPYAGLRISFVRGKAHIPTSTQTLDLNFSQDFPVGIFSGADIYLDQHGQTAVYIEGNMLDERSIVFGVKLRF